MSRPRPIETLKFLGCQDRNSSRLRNFLDVETKTRKFLGCRDLDSQKLGNLMDVKTETSRDWAKDVDTETLQQFLLISDFNLAQKRLSEKEMNL